MFRRLWVYRALLISLVRRQYQLRYRQSLVGITWAVLPTLASVLVATIVFHKVIGIKTVVPYPLFTLAGLAPWTLFASSVNSGVPSIAGSQSMISRLAFPRAILPLSMMGTSLIDLGVTMVVFVAYALFTQYGIPLTVLWLPLILLIEMVLITGVLLLGSSVNVFARDVRLAVPVVTQLWLYMTPVMYPLRTVPHSLRWLYLANPMTGLVESFRAALLYGLAPQANLLLPSIVGAVVLLVWGTWYFDATEPRFADVS